MNPQSTVVQKDPELPVQDSRMHRRKFLLFSSAAVSAAVIGVSCAKDTEANNLNNRGLNLGGGDTGVLNYAYALEQLEAAFYIQVMQTPYSGMTAMEQEYLKDIRDHEIAHREFFKNALGSNAISNVEVNFSTINFSNRDSVLSTAKAFEDLGVSAYNGAGRLLTSAAFLGLAGKIVSVEARHAAAIRELISPNAGTAFANSEVVDNQGLDVVRTPRQVLEIAAPFIKTALDASNLPNM